MLKPNTFAYTNNSVTLLSMLIMLWLAYITITQLVKQDNQTREVAYTPQPVLFHQDIKRYTYIFGLDISSRKSPPYGHIQSRINQRGLKIKHFQTQAFRKMVVCGNFICHHCMLPNCLDLLSHLPNILGLGEFRASRYIILHTDARFGNIIYRDAQD